MSEPASDPPAAVRARRPGTVVAAAILLAMGAAQAVGFAFSGSAEAGSAAVLGMLGGFQRSSQHGDPDGWG
jgi:hypothetical protein